MLWTRLTPSIWRSKKSKEVAPTRDRSASPVQEMLDAAAAHQRAIGKVHKLDETRLVELYQDVRDEMDRRINAIEPYLPPRAEFHERRNNARYRLAEMGYPTLSQLALDLSTALRKTRASSPSIIPNGESSSRGNDGGNASRPIALEQDWEAMLSQPTFDHFAEAIRAHEVNGGLPALPFLVGQASQRERRHHTMPGVVPNPPRHKNHRRHTTPMISVQVHKISEHPVAVGGYSEIHIGTTTTGRKVAMKALRFHKAPEKVIKRFYREAELWSQLQHEHILPFVGIYEQDQRLYMISDWSEHGNALDYVAANPRADKTAIMRQTAEALEYLHSGKDVPAIIHGDIHCGNVLISDKGQAMLTDFGLSYILEDLDTNTGSSLRGAGTFRFMAPELLIPPKDGGEAPAKSPETDVYAFGSFMLELFTGMRPFNHLKLDAQVIAEIQLGRKPRRPVGTSGMPESLWRLCEVCWSTLPSERPSMREVCIRLGML